MSVDKFGRHEDYVLRKENINQSQESLTLTPSGNYDMKNRILQNVGEPTLDNDAINLSYLKNQCLMKKKSPNELFNPGSFDASNNQIRNLGDGVNDTDAVNVRTLKREVNKLMREQQQQYEKLSMLLFQHVHSHTTTNSK